MSDPAFRVQNEVWSGTFELLQIFAWKGKGYTAFLMIFTL
jgi:hypothetical protein